MSKTAAGKKIVPVRPYKKAKSSGTYKKSQYQAIVGQRPTNRSPDY